MKRVLALILVFLFSLVGLVLAGPVNTVIQLPPVSNPGSGEAVPEVVPEQEAYLAGMFVYGGMCPEGACQQGYLITESGLILQGNEQLAPLGNASEADIVALRQAMSEEIFVDMPLQPFTETCPTAYDGNGFVLYFYDESGLTTLDSCEWDLSELRSVALVSEIVTKALQQANTTSDI